MIGEVRLMTWNVNGLRACVQRLNKKNLKDLLDALGADILCFQETKMTRSELGEELARPEGYDAFYAFCRVRSGYSGVVTFCRSGVVPTSAAEEGLAGTWPVDDGVGHIGSKHHELSPKILNELETEGRCVITDHQAFVLINVYCPATRNSERLEYKLGFHELLEDRVRALQQAGKRVIVVGDINIAHREIDHCDPEPYHDGEFGDHPCRQWMNRVVVSTLAKDARDHDDHRLVDTFRHFHPTEARAYTCWSMVTAARQTNYGTRIDYILMDRNLLDESATACSVESQQQGSDHCPVVCTLVVQFDASTTKDDKTASLCAKYYVEFAGKQQTLKSFFVQRTKNEEISSSPSNGSPRLRIPNQRRGKGRISGRPSQPSIKSFFSQKPHATVALEPIPKADGSIALVSATIPPTPTTPHTDSIDPTVWHAFLGSKRRLEEEEQNKWKQVLSGQPPKTPLCHCGEPSVLRTVLKTNENWGRKFYVCTRPAGEKGHPDARCEYFQWVDQKSTKRPKS